MSTLPRLTIRRVDAIPVSLPLIKPMTLAKTRITASINLLARIEAMNGVVGWGEAATMPTAGGENLAAVSRSMSKIAAYLPGKNARDHSTLMAALRAKRGVSRAALSIVDMAMLDLIGRQCGLPISSLLGGRIRDRVTPMWLIGSPTIEADVEEARRQLKLGYTFFKIKVGAKPLAGSIATTNALRKALGPHVTLCADANMNLDARGAAAYVRGVAGANLLYFEQPFATGEIEAMARLARTSPIAVGVDESVGDIADIVAHHRAGAAKGVAIKSITLGSLAETVKAAAVGNALGMAVNVSAKIAESSVAGAALLHVASVIEDASWGVSPTSCYVAEDIVRNPLELVDGQLAVPDGGGLGVEIDAAAVKRLRVR
jgi:L-alanine-DL-glutamate epimerase-like enolase superfamily enzyme